MGTSLFFQLFAGVPMDAIDTFPLIPLGCWLLPIGIYILLISLQPGMDRQNRRFVVIRYGMVQKWWKNYFVKNIFNGGLTAVIMLFLFKIFELLISQRKFSSLKEMAAIVVIWTVHVITISALFILMEAMNVKKLIPSILLLLEGLTFLGGYRIKGIAHFMFGTWGMYVQSSLYDGVYGFSIMMVLAAEVLIIAVCYLLKEYRNMESIIKVENVSKKFGADTALNNVSIEFESGKIYGIVGRNGSGKTVLFKTIIGFLKPTSGKVIVDGKEIGRDTDFADNIGIIIETPGFLSSYTGFKNLEYLASIKNVIGKKKIQEIMERVGLDPNSKKKVGKYSLGMRQRLGIAQAIMENPDILILDEPMNGLDNQGVEEVRGILLNLHDEGKAIILASHNKEDIEVLCDEVYEMDHGKLTASA